MERENRGDDDDGQDTYFNNSIYSDLLEMKFGEEFRIAERTTDSENEILILLGLFDK